MPTDIAIMELKYEHFVFIGSFFKFLICLVVVTMLTLDQKKHAISEWILSESLKVVRRSFRHLSGFHSKNLPLSSTIRSVLKKFEGTGTLLDLRKGMKSVILPLHLRRLRTLYQKKQRVSLSSAPKKLEIPTRKVRNILRLSLLKKAFKAKVRQKLTERQRKARFDTSKVLLNKQRILPHTLWFTDESWFYSDGIVQTSRGRMNTTGHCLKML